MLHKLSRWCGGRLARVASGAAGSVCGGAGSVCGGAGSVVRGALRVASEGPGVRGVACHPVRRTSTVATVRGIYSVASHTVSETNIVASQTAVKRTLCVASHPVRFTSSVTVMSVEAAKSLAGRAAVDNHVTGQTRVVGVGSGSTIVYAVKRLAERVKEEGLQIRCIPTSFQARQLIHSHGLVLSDLESDPRIDVTIDGCDEADSKLTLIKGGGGCQTQEKVVAAYSDQFVVIADYRKDSTTLGQAWDYVPLEVLALAYKPVMARVEKELGGHCKVRMAKAKAGPVVTDNGGMLVDWYWDREAGARDWGEVDGLLHAMPGLLETGLFVDMADRAYFGMEDGTVTHRDRVV